MADTAMEAAIAGTRSKTYGSVSNEELVTMYDDLLLAKEVAQCAPAPEENLGDRADTHQMEYQGGQSHSMGAEGALPDSLAQSVAFHISELHFTPPDAPQFGGIDISAGGPPTFGDAGRGARGGSEDGFALPMSFDGLSNNYVVVRNIGSDMQNATLSFGYDDPQYAPSQRSEAIETVNYYIPEPSVMPCVDYNGSGVCGTHRTQCTSINSNMGGDTTASTHGVLTDNEDCVCEREQCSADECSRQSSPGAGGRPAGYRKGYGHRCQRRNPSPVSESAQCSDSDASEDAASAASGAGLFEVPLKVCSMSRIIDPFKGFTKVLTSRAVRLVRFARKGNRTFCRLDRNAANLLQSQIKNLKVVSVSVCGDSKTGKSYLASMLVNQPVKSFRCSEAYDVRDAMNQLQQPAEGTMWAYVGVYQEKFAYIYLDLDGFENNQPERIHMIAFALLLSNCVICSVANPPRTGIYDVVRAMIDMTKSERGGLDFDEKTVNMDQTIEEFKKKASFLMNKQNPLAKSFDGADDGDAGEESDTPSEREETDVWRPPIVHFVFRDSEGHVKCLDERMYTPETLVEQGIFDHYTNIFNCNRKEKAIDFKNDMLDAFEVFSKRKYNTLPSPVLAPAAFNPLQHSAASNAKDALKRIFATLLAPSNAEIMQADVGESSATRFIGAYTPLGQPSLTTIPNHLLNPLFCERLDELKVSVYQDTLAHAQWELQLNGRMFVAYLQLLIAHFNTHGQVKLEEARAMLRDVYVKENESISKDVVVQFFKGLKQHVVTQLPMEPRVLFSRCMRLKQKSLSGFQLRVLGSHAQYREQYEQLEKSLDGLIEKLESKNDKIAVDAATALFDKCAKRMEDKLSSEDYTYDEMLVDIAKLRKMFLQKFTGHSEVTEKVFPQLSQRLHRAFEEHHPRTPMPNVVELSKRYGDQ
ncbi:guanylate-binding protein, putative [Babesia caballi]|uniref:Guanylate-binding protein, putative n=1 Tax=Babesia caballi TaxID=5871 RepID=A0AAV4LT79_BABCB|nr:guanylate-binding protein, putative [Babesia caballi]